MNGSPRMWRCSQSSTTFTDEPSGEVVEIDLVSLVLQGDRGFLPTEEFTKKSIMLGAEIAIVGLFRSHYGKNKSMPIIQTETSQHYSS